VGGGLKYICVDVIMQGLISEKNNIFQYVSDKANLDQTMESFQNVPESAHIYSV
jgi:hypothetical protein